MIPFRTPEQIDLAIQSEVDQLIGLVVHKGSRRGITLPYDNYFDTPSGRKMGGEDRSSLLAAMAAVMVGEGYILTLGMVLGEKAIVILSFDHIRRYPSLRRAVEARDYVPPKEDRPPP